MTRYVMAIDLDRCLGCDACVVACATENQVPWDGGSRLRMREVVVGTFPNLSGEFRPEACFHCDNPPCVAACPTGATYQTTDGVVLVNQARCTGCKACVTACPYGMRYLHAEGYVDKCTYCYHRLQQGREPACVETCPTGARVFGDADDPGSRLRQTIAASQATTVQSRAGAQPRLVYLNSTILKDQLSLEGR